MGDQNKNKVFMYKEGNKHDSKNNLIRIISFSYILGIATLFMAYLIRILSAKNLESWEFGTFYFIFSITGFLVGLVNLGLDESFIYYFNKLKKEVLVVNYIISILLLSIFLLLVFLLTKDHLMYLFRINENIFYYLFIVFFLLYLISNMVSSYFLIKINIINIQISNFIRVFIALIILIIFIYFNSLDYNLFLFAWILGFLFSLLYVFLYILKNDLKRIKNYLKISNYKISRENWNVFKKQIKYGLLINLSTLSGYFMFYIDTFLVNFFLGPANYALYSIAYSILTFPSTIFLLLANFLFPVSVQKNKKELAEIMNKINNFFLFVILPFSISFLIYSKEIVLLLFGEKYLDSYLVLSVFGIFLAFSMMNGYNIHLIKGLGKVSEENKAYIFLGILNFILDFLVLISDLDESLKLMGVALFTGISWFLLAIYNIFLIKKELKVQISYLLGVNKRFLIKLFFLNLIFLITIHIFKKFFVAHPILEFISAFFFMGIFYLIFAFYLRIIPKILFEIFDYFFNLVPNTFIKKIYYSIREYYLKK